MQILFMYNADSGLFDKMSDFAHKIWSPSTYSCDLCMITYGNFTMKKEWKSFLQNLPHEKIFLHKDQLEDFPELKDTEVPAIAVKAGTNVTTLINAKELHSLDTIENLISLLSQRLKPTT